MLYCKVDLTDSEYLTSGGHFKWFSYINLLFFADLIAEQFPKTTQQMHYKNIVLPLVSVRKSSQTICCVDSKDYC